MACTLLVPANIRATTRRYRKVRHTQLHCAMPLSGNFAIQAKWLIQSSLNLHFLLGAIFFNGGFAISLPDNYGKQRTLAIIQSESTTHGTSLTVAVLMLPAGGVKNKQPLIWLPRVKYRRRLSACKVWIELYWKFVTFICCVTRQKSKIIGSEKKNNAIF